MIIVHWFNFITNKGSKTSLTKGAKVLCVDPSVPSILRPQVRIPTFFDFNIYIGRYIEIRFIIEL